MGEGERKSVVGENIQNAFPQFPIGWGAAWETTMKKSYGVRGRGGS